MIFNLISSSHFVLPDGTLQTGGALLSSASQGCSGTSLELSSERFSLELQSLKLFFLMKRYVTGLLVK